MDPAAKLRKLGYTVVQFNQYHFRVEDMFDYWLPRGKWWYRVTDERGQKPLEQLVFYIQQRIGPPDTHREFADHEDFVQRLISVGWAREDAEQAWKERQECTEKK